MKILYKIISIFLLVTVLSCNEYLNVNDNPNQLKEVPSGTLLLKGTLLANAQIQHGQLARTSMYYTGGLIGLDLVQQTLYNYDYTPGDSNPVWEFIYNGILVQNKEIRRLSPELDLLQAVVDINEALAVGTATSLFGDIPYSSAVPDDPSSAPDPTYDPQAEVYASLQTLLDGAVSKIDNASTTLGAADIYHDGDKDYWQKTAYTLKARYYLQTKRYAEALRYVDKGIDNPQATLAYKPIGSVNTNSNLFFIFVNGTRAGDMTGDGAFFRSLLDTANTTGRNHAKTNETARRNYCYISGNGHQKNGIDDATAPMQLVSYEENLLIWAECLVRGGDFSGAIDKLNELREHLSSGDAFNRINESDPLQYDAYVEADFQDGGIENSDGIDPNRALLREIIEERYVTGFTTYMPFNDVRRLRTESDLLVPFPLNNTTTTVNPQRFLYPQIEINSNENTPDPIPDLFTPTSVNQ